jgi:hypothetical protein
MTFAAALTYQGFHCAAGAGYGFVSHKNDANLVLRRDRWRGSTSSGLLYTGFPPHGLRTGQSSPGRLKPWVAVYLHQRQRQPGY